MHDEFDGRIWVAHRAALMESLDRLFSSVGIALARLHEMQFSAPWRQRRLHGPGQA